MTQIGKIHELLDAGLRKSWLLSEPVKQVIETQGEVLVFELVAVVRKRVEAVSSLIIRRVKVDLTRTPEQMLKATGCHQYTDADVVEAMPKGEGGEGDVFFFKPRPEAYDQNGWISDDNLEKEFELHGLKPCDLTRAQLMLRLFFSGNYGKIIL